jgi:hypothetical protein
MRNRWLEPLIIALGLTSLGLAGCKADDGDGTADEIGDVDGNSESEESTTAGDTSCIPDELGCECSTGLCLGNLVCMGEVCVEGSDTSSTDSETGMQCEPPEMLCDGVCVDIMNDDSNCGECGNECHIALDVGECVNGACAPTYSDCISSPDDPKPSCTEVCQMQGFAGCSACGPNDLTIVWYSSVTTCENDSPVASDGEACQNQPTNFPFFDYRCCCAQQ